MTTFSRDALSGGSLQSGQPGEFTGSRTHGTGWSNGEEGGGGFWNGANSPDAPDAGDYSVVCSCLCEKFEIFELISKLKVGGSVVDLGSGSGNDFLTVQVRLR